MDAAKFFGAVRTAPFSGSLSQEAVDGINAIVPAWEQYGDGDVRKLAYILATAFHEADRFRTMREYASGQAYEGRRDLGNTQAGDGRRFRGRGFVQITGRRNYTDWSKRLGLDLVANPELAEQRPIAARILVEGMMLGTFTGKSLRDYIDGDDASYTEARRTVNGTDKAALIAGYASQFERALEDADYDEAPAPVEPVIIVTAPASEAPMPHQPGAQPASVPPKPDLTPVEQSNKAVAAGKGGMAGTGVAAALVTIILAADILPAAMETAEVGAAIGVVLAGLCASVQSTIAAYRARDKRFMAAE